MSITGQGHSLTWAQGHSDFKIKACFSQKLLDNYPLPKAEDIGLSMSVRPSLHLSVLPSVRSHYYLTAKRNFIKLILNMYHYNDLMHVKFGSLVIALELI